MTPQLSTQEFEFLNFAIRGRVGRKNGNPRQIPDKIGFDHAARSA
jgi:hypothetical protein